MNSKRKYKPDWAPYAFPQGEGSFADENDIRNSFFRFEPNNPVRQHGGAPIFVGEDGVYINDGTEMAVIFGETGSKKTRAIVAPTICLLAKSGESIVITDVKGELSGGTLSSKIMGVLEENGYNTVVLNFRDMNADCYNVLLRPYRLYKQGNTDAAMEEASNIISDLSSIYNNTRADPFWTQMASVFNVAVLKLIFEYATSEKEVNMLSLASYCNEDAAVNLANIIDMDNSQKDTAAMIMLRSVLSAPDKTRQSILASAAAFLQPFTNNESLSEMLGQNTFDPEDIYLKKTALFLVVPDEVGTYDRIVGIIIRQISEILVSAAYRNGGSLDRRVNFVLDEFCNISPGDGFIGRAMSAHRSRNIRYYIVCQGLRQLQDTYPIDFATILTNCRNIYYLNSSDRELLKYLSEGSGVTYETPDGSPKPLISIYDLQNLKKEKEYAECYVKSGNIQFVAQLPDIDQYDFLKNYNVTYPAPLKHRKKLKIYNSNIMVRDIRHRMAEENSIYKLTLE